MYLFYHVTTGKQDTSTLEEFILTSATISFSSWWRSCFHPVDFIQVSNKTCKLLMFDSHLICYKRC